MAKAVSFVLATPAEHPLAAAAPRAGVGRLGQARPTVPTCPEHAVGVCSCRVLTASDESRKPRSELTVPSLGHTDLRTGWETLEGNRGTLRRQGNYGAEPGCLSAGRGFLPALSAFPGV